MNMLILALSHCVKCLIGTRNNSCIWTLFRQCLSQGLSSYGLTVYEKKKRPFVREPSDENVDYFYLCFRLQFIHGLIYFFSILQPPLLSLGTVFVVLLFYSVETRYLLTYSGRNHRFGKVYYNFCVTSIITLISHNVTQGC